MLEKIKIYLRGHCSQRQMKSVVSFKVQMPYETVFPTQEYFWAIHFLRLWSLPPNFSLSFSLSVSRVVPLVKASEVALPRGTIIWVPGHVLPSLPLGCENRGLLSGWLKGWPLPALPPVPGSWWFFEFLWLGPSPRNEHRVAFSSASTQDVFSEPTTITQWPSYCLRLLLRSPPAFLNQAFRITRLWPLG